jgi:hypothetical protein
MAQPKPMGFIDPQYVQVTGYQGIGQRTWDFRQGINSMAAYQAALSGVPAWYQLYADRTQVLGVQGFLYHCYPQQRQPCSAYWQHAYYMYMWYLLARVQISLCLRWQQQKQHWSSGRKVSTLGPSLPCAKSCCSFCTHTPRGQVLGRLQADCRQRPGLRARNPVSVV